MFDKKMTLDFATSEIAILMIEGEQLKLQVKGYG